MGCASEVRKLSRTGWPVVGRLPPMAIRNLVMTKRQELKGFAERPAESHWLSWLEAV